MAENWDEIWQTLDYGSSTSGHPQAIRRAYREAMWLPRHWADVEALIGLSD